MEEPSNDSHDLYCIVKSEDICVQWSHDLSDPKYCSEKIILDKLKAQFGDQGLEHLICGYNSECDQSQLNQIDRIRKGDTDLIYHPLITFYFNEHLQRLPGITPIFPFPPFDMGWRCIAELIRRKNAAQEQIYIQ